MRYLIAIAAGLSVTLIAIPGCGDSRPPPVAVSSVPADGVSVEAANVDTAASEQTPTSDADNSVKQKIVATAGAELSKAKALKEPFKPPFGHRVDLFAPPQRTQKAVQKNNDTGETVELQGFVNVDQPRVVLSVAGIVAPIAEGEEKYGIQVITINPPKVVLQRGRERWTATLEN